VGVAFHEQPHGRDGETTLNNAEQALDEARKVFGDAVRSFAPDTSTRQEKARRIERSLWSALANDQFFVAYQPQVRLSDLKIIGAEALVRWRHPTMGMVFPGDFIEIAETSGFIEDLGRWVLHQGTTERTEWMPKAVCGDDVTEWEPWTRPEYTPEAEALLPVAEDLRLCPARPAPRPGSEARLARRTESAASAETGSATCARRGSAAR